MIENGDAGHRRQLRSIGHRGPKAPERITVVPTTIRRVDTTLPAGSTLSAAIAQLLEQEGARGGCVELAGGAFSPFHFVMPALPHNDEHVIWYSETISPEGRVELERGTCVIGWRDGALLVHVHGVWTTAAGRRYAGHMLPQDSVIAVPISAKAYLTSEATYEMRFDAETNFTLFSPEGDDSGVSALVRIRPDQDISEAIETAATRLQIERASVHGIGSFVGIEFTDGRTIDTLAAEAFITGGQLSPSGEGVRLTGMNATCVGLDGLVYEGELLRCANPVCVTFEALIVAEMSDAQQ